MAKKSAAAASVAVRLNCILSGFPGDPGPGAIVTVDADEAKRLIDLGAATIADADTGEVAPSLEEADAPADADTGEGSAE